MNCSLPGSSVRWDSPGKNTGVGCHALLQGIFQTQGSNQDLPHCRQFLDHSSHRGSPSKYNTKNAVLSYTFVYSYIYLSPLSFYLHCLYLSYVIFSVLIFYYLSIYLFTIYLCNSCKSNIHLYILILPFPDSWKVTLAVLRLLLPCPSSFMPTYIAKRKGGQGTNKKV